MLILDRESIVKLIISVIEVIIPLQNPMALEREFSIKSTELFNFRRKQLKI